MPKNQQKFYCFWLIFALAIAFAFSFLFVHPVSAIPSTIDLQGRVTDKQGKEVSDSTYPITFSLYNVADGGKSIWQETQNVAVTGSLFSVTLGNTNSLSSLDFSKGDYYLGINFNNDGEMSPRKKLSSVPFAQTSTTLAGKSSSDFVLKAGDTMKGNLNLDKYDLITTGKVSAASFLQGSQTLADLYLSKSGGTLTGSLTVAGVLGLTDSDIPNTITASHYLPLAGGTLTGDLTVNGINGLTDADIPNNITAVNYLPLAGGALTGNLNFASGQTFPGYLSLSGGTLIGNLTFAAGQTFPDTLTTAGGTLTGPLAIQGATGTLSVASIVSLQGATTISGASTLSGATTISGALTVSSGATFTGSVTTQGLLTANAGLTLSSGTLTLPNASVADAALSAAANDAITKRHTQNIDTGTTSLTYGLGTGTATGTNNFDLQASSAANKPALRYSGTAGAWQVSNDGTTFANIGVAGGTYINLQGSTPGTQQTGHLNISGTAIAGTFSGSGASLSSLSASNISSGTLDDARLSANVAHLNAAETIASDWVNTANPWADNEVSDTLTIGASSTVADAALSANVAHLNAAETIASDWVNTANPWADNEVADDLTITSTKLLQTTLTTEQLRLSYDGSNYLSTTVGLSGAVTLNATGAGAAFTFSDATTVSSLLTASNGLTLSSGTLTLPSTSVAEAALSANAQDAITKRHTQNTDTGTTSLTYGLGTGTAISTNNFDLPISNAANKPALRYSGTSSQWQISNDGTSFSAILTAAGTYVNLQGSTPGTQQTGHLNISGTAIAGTFSGSGASLTSLSATNISSGTLDDARLSANVAHLNAAETISSDWVNIANPWADNEVADDLTITSTKLLQTTLTTEQLRLSYDGSNYLSTTVGSTGGVTLNATGAGAGFTFSDATTISSLLTASNGLTLSSGTLTLPSTSVADAALSSNVALLNRTGQLFTGTNTIRTTTANQLTIGYDASNYYTTTVAATGGVTFDATGAGAAFTFSDATTISSLLTASNSLTLSSGTLTLPATSVADAALSANVAHLNAAETIASNWVNTANPWADNEVADDLTITSTKLLQTTLTTEQLRLSYDGSNYLSTTVGSTGGVTLNATGAGAAFTFSDALTASGLLTASNGLTLSSGTLTLPSTSVADAALSANVAHLNAAETISSNWVNTANPWADNEVADDLTITSTKLLQTTLTTEQLRLSYDGSNYLSTTVGSTGGVTLNATGAGAAFTFSDALTASGLLTASNGLTLSSGTLTLPSTSVADAALSSNVALLNRNGQLFTGFNMIEYGGPNTVLTVDNTLGGSNSIFVASNDGAPLFTILSAGNVQIATGLTLGTTGGSTLTIGRTNASGTATINLNSANAAYNFKTTTRHIALSAKDCEADSGTPTAAVVGKFPVWRFTDGETDAIHCAFDIPDDWSAGTDLTLKIKYSGNTIINATPYGVKWNLDGNAPSGNTSIDTASAFSGTTTHSTYFGFPNSRQIPAGITISNSVLTANDTSISIKITRDGLAGGDTYIGSADIHLIQIWYTATTPKSQ